MGLNEYIDLVEKEYGKVTLPKDDCELDEILEYLNLSLEKVSKQDYRILQAMLIIDSWRKLNDNIRTETSPFHE